MTSFEALKQAIEQIRSIPEDSFTNKLNNRKLAELEFHDRERDEEFRQKASEDKDLFDKYYGNKKYYKANGKSISYIQDWIKKNSKDKVFLDYACGNGDRAIWAAQSGAKLALGLDLSSVSISNAQKSAEELGIFNNISFFQGDCEDTLLPDNSIDTIICSGMLHHLDLSYAFPELRRILKPGGKILAVEALDYNPLIKIYRSLTPEMRTDWEKQHILSLKDLNFASNFFEVNNVKYWHLSSILAGKFSLKLLPLCNVLDGLLTSIPGVQLMSWIFTFELIKNKE